jgi:hypothetical protein
MNKPKLIIAIVLSASLIWICGLSFAQAVTGTDEFGNPINQSGNIIGGQSSQNQFPAQSQNAMPIDQFGNPIFFDQFGNRVDRFGNPVFNPNAGVNNMGGPTTDQFGNPIFPNTSINQFGNSLSGPRTDQFGNPVFSNTRPGTGTSTSGATGMGTSGVTGGGNVVGGSSRGNVGGTNHGGTTGGMGHGGGHGMNYSPRMDDQELNLGQVQILQAQYNNPDEPQPDTQRGAFSDQYNTARQWESENPAQGTTERYYERMGKTPEWQAQTERVPTTENQGWEQQWKQRNLEILNNRIRISNLNSRFYGGMHPADGETDYDRSYYEPGGTGYTDGNMRTK